MMDAKTITKTRLPGRHGSEGRSWGTGRIVGLEGNPACLDAIAKVASSGPVRCFDSGETCLVAAAPYGQGRGDEVGLTLEGRPDANVTVEELSRRKKDWKPCEHVNGAGALWKYAQLAGPAVSGAVTHPGGLHEGVCYADI